MLRLYYANRLENLIAPLADSIRDWQRRNALERCSVIVPNRAIEEFVKSRVAERIGIAANLEFLFLRRFLGDRVCESAPSLRVLDFEQLQLILFECIRAASRSDRDLAPVRDYLAEGDDRTRERRAMELAGNVARLFREYSISRRAMLRRWQSAPQFADTSFAGAERWQRRLWQMIFDERGAVRREWLKEPSLKWMLLPDAFDSMPARDLERIFRGRLFVFGLAYAGPAFIRIFSRLGEIIELPIFALNPCQEFWEDVEDIRARNRLKLVRRGEKIGAAVDAEGDPFGLAAAKDNQALGLWGRPGREYIRLLNEIAECDFTALFNDPADGRESSILHTLQKSILERQPEREPRSDSDSMSDDGSIRILACPGIRRELEIVANEIWSLMQSGADGNSPPLRFHEIGVMIPDSQCDAYLPHLEGVFAEQHDIPVEIVLRRLADLSRVAEAIELLIRLPLGRFGRVEMMRLLKHPAIIGSDPDFDPEQWTAWTRELGLFFGADEDDLGATYFPRDLAHWDQALRRIALGVFMTGEPSGDSRAFATPEDHSLRPLEISEDEIAGATRLLGIARPLIADALELHARTMPLERWAEALAAMIAAYVHPEDAIGERVYDQALAAIESIAAEGVKSKPVGYAVAADLALARIGDAGSRQSAFSGRGVAAGPLSGLRAIPFRVIFVLGLGENFFPERERDDTLDLRRARRSAGDVSPAERDRYLFLETILAARERLYLSYLARDSSTGGALEPSSVIYELQTILRLWLDPATLGRITIRHPLSRYDLKYFPELSPSGERIATLVSYDSEAKRGAQMAALRADLAHSVDAALPGRSESLLDLVKPQAARVIRGSLRSIEPPDSSSMRREIDVLSIPLAALRRFLECPLQSAARYALGMLEEEDASDGYDDDEPLDATRLERTILLREAFVCGRGEPNKMRTEYERAFASALGKGRMPAGPFAKSERDTDFAMLELWTRQARESGMNDLSHFLDVRLGPADEFAKTDLLLDAIELEIDLPAAPGVRKQRVSLYGRARCVSPRFDAAVHPVIRKEPIVRSFAECVISAMALAASGKSVGREFTAIVLAGEKWKRDKGVVKLPKITREAARGYLAVLAIDLLSAANHYFFPIEAVADYLEQQAKGGDPVGAVYELRSNEFDHCASDYGPVRLARLFDPPPDDLMRKIVARRYQPIREIFER